ncbi:MAG TPA: hypothetical protein VF768_11735 [Holophagaceae bacterium]
MTEKATPPPTQDDRPGITIANARAYLAEHGLVRSRRTIYRWLAAGILTRKRITHGTVFLFRDEVEALLDKPNPWD